MEGNIAIKDALVVRKKKQRTVNVVAFDFGGAFNYGINEAYEMPKFDTPDQLDELIQEYFEGLLDENNEMLRFPTISGLALALGLANLDDLSAYEGPYKYLLNRAKLTCQYFYETALTTRHNTSGAIFALKAGFGWKEDPSTQINIQNNLTVKTQLAWDDPEEETQIQDGKTES